MAQLRVLRRPGAVASRAVPPASRPFGLAGLPVWGVQFHPEVRAPTSAILARRLDDDAGAVRPARPRGDARRVGGQDRRLERLGRGSALGALPRRSPRAATPASRRRRTARRRPGTSTRSRTRTRRWRGTAPLSRSRSARAKRPIGTWTRRRAAFSGSLANSSCSSGVSTGPGQSALTRTPRRANSTPELARQREHAALRGGVGDLRHRRAHHGDERRRVDDRAAAGRRAGAGCRACSTGRPT